MTYPNKANITGDQNTPLPIEMAYFIEDSEPDNHTKNRPDNRSKKLNFTSLIHHKYLMNLMV